MMALRALYNLLCRLPLTVWHRLQPTRDSYMDEALAFYHKRDAQENTDTSPPGGIHRLVLRMESRVLHTSPFGGPARWLAQTALVYRDHPHRSMC